MDKKIKSSDKVQEDWLETVWEIKENIFQETKHMSLKEYFDFVKKETESQWKKLENHKKEKVLV